MPIITKINDQQCLQECQDELGPAVGILEKHCTDGTRSVICIPCNQQRGDLTLDGARQFTEVNDQCSSRTRKRESGKTAMANISLGKGANRLDILAAIFDTVVKEDRLNPDCQIVEILDEPGKCPCHWQLTLLPIQGNRLITSFGIILEYAIVATTQFQFIFSPTTQRQVPLQLEAEPHPTTGRLGMFVKSKTGQPCPMLEEIAGDCQFDETGAIVAAVAPTGDSTGDAAVTGG